MTKMVQLADDAYDRLQAAKRPGESFSQVVRRLTRKKGSLLDLAMLGRSEKDRDAHAELVRRIRAQDDKRWAERVGRDQ